MSVIYCNIQPFIFKQSIVKIDTDGGKDPELLDLTPLSTLNTKLTQLCYTNNIYQIKLEGIKDLTDNVKQEVLKNELNTYSTNKITFID